MAKPVHELKIGLQKISIFENDGENGKYHNAQLEGRRYKDGDDWKTTHSFNISQLAKHIALCNAVLNWMIEETPSS